MILKSISWSQEVRHDLTNYESMFWRQKIRDDVKKYGKYVMIEIETYVIFLKVCHNVKKYVMA